VKNFALAICATFLCFGYVSGVWAQSSHPRLVCEACRNPNFFPRDYRNFAFNQVVGPNTWMTLEMANFFEVINLDGHSVFVDINIDIEMFTIDLGLPLTLPYPVGLELQVILNLENGDQLVYALDPRAYPRGLPVGGRRGTPGGGGGGAGPPRSGPPDQPPTRLGRVCGTTQVDRGKKRRTCRAR